MFKIGFDNDRYVELQSEKIRERVDQFGGKLYLEFGGKLFSMIIMHQEFCRALKPDSKIRMLKALADDAEIVIAINADAIEKNKRRGDIGITYDQEALRLIDAFTEFRTVCGKCCNHAVRRAAPRGEIRIASARSRRKIIPSLSDRIPFEYSL